MWCQAGRSNTCFVRFETLLRCKTLLSRHDGVKPGDSRHVTVRSSVGQLVSMQEDTGGSAPVGQTAARSSGKARRQRASAKVARRDAIITRGRTPGFIFSAVTAASASLATEATTEAANAKSNTANTDADATANSASDFDRCHNRVQDAAPGGISRATQRFNTRLPVLQGSIAS